MFLLSSLPFPIYSSYMDLHAELDRCVMCGMCSQHCPTYALTADENESPRGRIALIGAFNNGQLDISDKLVTHLEHCTGCRACEEYCPSAVRFGAIMDSARALIARQRPQPRIQHQIQNLLAKPQQTQRLERWLGRYQRWGLQRLMRASGLLSLTGLSKSDGLLPKQLTKTTHPPKQSEYSPAVGEQAGDVALFTGCISSIFDREALDASRDLLNRLGYGVYTPTGQTCCGAMHQHNGYPGKASELAKKNLNVFNKLNIEAIVHTSTGCTSFLQEYNQLVSGGSFTTRVQDINQFLLNVNWPSDLVIRPLPIQIAIHEPCSARNVMHVANKPYELLEAIPELECAPLPDNALCCGAAGSQLLSPSTISLKLQQKKLDALIHLKTNLNIDTNIDTLVTTNIGCALHLAAGLREQNQSVEVLHPVTLLFRQLEKIETCTLQPASAKVIT
jgi:glycolate oxidase iron-sulfur subunit